MSQENVELHRRSVAAFNTRDVEAFMAFCDPEIELQSTVTVPGGATYNGHDGVRSWHRDLEDGWGGELRVEPEAFYDLGEHTISLHVLHGKGRQSGADVAMPAAHLCKWRDGLMTYFKGYAHQQDVFREDVFKDVSVSEGDLKPLDP